MTTDMAVLKHELTPFEIMDSWDSEAMLAEMQGAIAKTLVYEFKMDGKTVTGLSKIGVDECCIVLARDGQVIREEDLTWQILGEGEAQEAIFKAFAARYAVSAGGEMLLERVIGVKRQPLYEYRGGTKKLNPHWLETGAMKAVRNARFRLIPSNIREGVIAAAKKMGSIRSGGGAEHSSGKGSLPQPDPEEVESQALKELQGILPSLAANQQEWVREKLGDGASPLDLLEFAREKMPRPKAKAESAKSSSGTKPSDSADSTGHQVNMMPSEQNPAGGDNE